MYSGWDEENHEIQQMETHFCLHLESSDCKLKALIEHEIIVIGGPFNTKVSL